MIKIVQRAEGLGHIAYNSHPFCRNYGNICVSLLVKSNRELDLECDGFLEELIIETNHEIIIIYWMMFLTNSR